MATAARGEAGQEGSRGRGRGARLDGVRKGHPSRGGRDGGEPKHSPEAVSISTCACRIPKEDVAGAETAKARHGQTRASGERLGWPYS